jgi:NADH-quinone oxidoreductase subunit J
MIELLNPSLLPLAAGVLHPLAIIAFCTVAGIATAMILPSRRENSFRKIGGVILLAGFLVFAATLIRQAAQQSFADVYFWLFSAIAVIAAMRVVTHSKPVYSALYFVLTVIATAGLFVLLWADFMAIALIIIYAGAILVTYIFVIMLASPPQAVDVQGQECDEVSREPLVASAIGFVLLAVLMFLIFDKAAPLNLPVIDTPNKNITIRDFGEYLFNSQVLSLELAGVILTMAMVGAILIARRQVGTESGVQERYQAAASLPDVESDPHTIPIYGTRNPQAKAYPER